MCVKLVSCILNAFQDLMVVQGHQVIDALKSLAFANLSQL